MRGTLRATTTALAAALTVSLAGCVDNPQPTTLPSVTPSSPSPTPTSTKGMTDKEQVKTLYLDYAVNFQKGERMPKDKRREFLSQWMTGEALEDFVEGMERSGEKGKVTRGHDIPHIMSLTVRDKVAYIDDCSDASNVVTKDRRTGEILNRGDTYWQKTVLRKTSVGWRITGTWVKDSKCVP